MLPINSASEVDLQARLSVSSMGRWVTMKMLSTWELSKNLPKKTLSVKEFSTVGMGQKRKKALTKIHDWVEDRKCNDVVFAGHGAKGQFIAYVGVNKKGKLQFLQAAISYERI